MLKKLIKYDIRANIKVIAGTYIFITLLAVVHLIMAKLSQMNPDGLQWMYLEKITFVLYFLSLVAGFVITIVACVLHFRKNMFKDEGYLLHTLPVNEAMIFTSKFVSTVILLLGNIAGALITAIICVGSISWIRELFVKMTDGLKMSGLSSNALWFMFIFFIVAVFYSISQIFASITIGYSLGKKINKDIMSFIIYFAEYVIMQILTIILVAAFAFGNGMVTQAMSELEIIEKMQAYVAGVIGGSIVLMLVMAAVNCVLSVFFLNKKLNLDEQAGFLLYKYEKIVYISYKVI